MKIQASMVFLHCSYLGEERIGRDKDDPKSPGLGKSKLRFAESPETQDSTHGFDAFLEQNFNLSDHGDGDNFSRSTF
jgi:hypothetical protein